MKKVLPLLLFVFILNNIVFGQSNGNTLTFKGSTDQILVSDDPAWDLTGDFTMSVKVKFRLNKWHMLLTHHGSAAPQGFEFSYTGNRIRLSPDGYGYCIDAPWTASLNTWYLITVTRKGSLFSAYVDGNLVGTNTFSGPIGLDNAPLRIGNYYYPGYQFEGEMDDVSIWNAALGSSQLLPLVTGTLTGSEPNLVAFYNMDRTGGGQGLTVNNLSPAGSVFDGTTQGTPSTPYFTTPPQPAGALDFDGVDDYAEIPDNSLFDFGTQNFTIEFWAYKKSPTTFYNSIALGKWNTGGSPGTNEWAISLANNVTGDIPSFAVESGSDIRVLSSQIPINVGQWWHIACVRENSLLKMYINGQAAGSLDIGPNFNINNLGRNILIGKLVPGYNSPIKLDDTRIWNRALCQQEISDRMNCQLAGNENGLVAYYKLNQGIADANNAGQTTLIDLTANQLNGTLYNFALNSASSNWVAGKNLGNCTATTTTCPPTPSQLYGPDLWLKADAGVITSGNYVTTWLDQSGSNRNATGSGNIQLIPNAYNGKSAVRFFGSTGMQTSAFQSFPNKRGTVIVVSKTNGAGSGSGAAYGTLVSTYLGSGIQWQYGATPSSFGFYDGVGSSNVNIGTVNPLEFGTTTLLRDENTTLKFYRNSTLNNSLLIADNQPSFNPIKIGWNGSNEILNGDIAEILFYGRALTTSELASVHGYLSQKYNFSGPVSSPQINLSKTSIDFGNLGLGFSLTDTVVITNTGNAPLNISNIASSNPAFQILSFKNNLIPNDTAMVVIRYTPSLAGALNETLTITHNATGSPSVISLSGNAVPTGYTYQVNQIPGFTGKLFGATWFDGRTGFVSGEGGKLFKTTDGGATWTLVPIGTTENIRSIRSIGSALWIFGSNGLICVSYNGGNSWIPFNTGTSNIFYDGYFVNGYYGFAVGANGTLCRYNGTGWQPYALGLTNQFYGVYAYGNYAWAVGSGGIVCRYNRASDAWSPVNPGVSNDLLGVGFWNDNIGYVVGTGGLIYRTLNGGNSWIPCNSGVLVDIRSIRCFSATVAWATCSDGTVLQTTDGGITWVKLPLGNFNFERLDFNNCQGIAICRNGAVVSFQTNLCNNGYNPYYTRHFTGTSYGYNSAWLGSKLNYGIGGRYGTLLITNNGGQSWNSTNPYTNEHINCLRIYGNTSFAAGNGGYLAKCNNLGTNWVRFGGIPSGINFYSMAFYSNGTGWAVGSGGTICFYNGSSWVPYNTGGIQNTFRCVYVIGNIAYAVGTNGIICKYNGTGWVDVSPGVSNDFYGCAFVTEKIGYAVGAGGIICKTINGGESWFPVTSPTGEDLHCVEVGCTLEAMVAGKNGAAFQTNDGGNAWIDRSLDRAVDINSISLLDGEGLLAAEDGEVYSFQFGLGKVTADLVANGPLTFCEGDSVSLTASGGSSYLWSNGSTDATIVVTESGTYSVTVSNAAGCSEEKEMTVIVNPKPVIEFTAPSALCINAGIIDLSALPSGGLFSGPGVNGNYFDPEIAGIGSKTITYSFTNIEGCASEASVVILVNDTTPIQWTLAQEVCKNGGIMNLNANPSGGIFEGPGVSGNTFNPSLAGTGNWPITYKFTNPEGCISTRNETILVNPVPTVNARQDAILYYGYTPKECTTLNASAIGGVPGYNFLWSNGSAGNSTQVCPSTTTNYSVSATDANGCTGSDEVTVNVVDVRCDIKLDKKTHKVTICHTVPQKRDNTLCVDQNAVPAHLAHGDYLGACAVTGIKSTEILSEVPEPVQIELFPNPAKNQFTIYFSEDFEKIQVNLLNANGKTVSEQKFSSHRMKQVTVQTNSINMGMYFVSITADGKHFVKKIIIE